MSTRQEKGPTVKKIETKGRELSEEYQQRGNKETESKGIKCPNCGNGIPRDVNFCAYCGEKIKKEESKEEELGKAREKAESAFEEEGEKE